MSFVFNYSKIFMQKHICRSYIAESGRGTGNEKVISILLESPEDILNKPENLVLNALEEENLSSSIGLYFYRFKSNKIPFIKIGECTGKEGIAKRFKRGWHGTKTYSDTYLAKKEKGQYVDSVFLTEVRNISKDNPAYFIFYEHLTEESHPKIDEVHAYIKHKTHFNEGTINKERINGNEKLGKNLVWHDSAFVEVLELKFPDNCAYG